MHKIKQLLEHPIMSLKNKKYSFAVIFKDATKYQIFLYFKTKYSGTSEYEFNLFRDGVRKMNYLYAEARFTF